jgi:hypothetical protein
MTANSDPHHDWFTPAGAIEISASALALARAFHEQVRKAVPDEDWVISFDWADSRSVRETGNGQWREVQPGLDLAAYERWKVPEQYVRRVGDTDIAVKIPTAEWEKSVERLIDVDESAFSGLILR